MRLPALARLGLLSAALLATSAQAQTVLSPGHPDLMTSELTLDSHVMAARVVPDEAAGTIRHTVQQSGDTVTLVVLSDAQRIGRSGEVTTTFRWPSMQAITRQPAGNDKNMTRYDGARVTGTWGQGDWDPLAFDITLENAAFAPEMLPFVARALPFRAGYSATVPTFTASSRLRDVTMTVEGQETFTKADGSTANVWAIEEVTPGRTVRTQRYLVDASTRDLVAMTASVQGTDIVIETTTQEALDAMAAERAMMPSLRPGGDALAVDALQSYSREYTVKLVQPQQQDIGTQTRTVTVDRGEGTVTIEEATSIPLAGQETSSMVMLAYPSLRPMSARSEAGGVVTDLTYNDDGVIRRQTPADDESPDYERAFEEPVFDPSILFEVVRLVPFEEGYRAAFETFNAEGALSIPVAVTGRDQIDGAEVWMVRASPEGSPPINFAVDAETRELVRVMLSPQAGVMIHFDRADG